MNLQKLVCWFLLLMKFPGFRNTFKKLQLWTLIHCRENVCFIKHTKAAGKPASGSEDRLEELHPNNKEVENQQQVVIKSEAVEVVLWKHI